MAMGVYLCTFLRSRKIIKKNIASKGNWNSNCSKNYECPDSARHGRKMLWSLFECVLLSNGKLHCLNDLMTLPWN